ncbi:MAG: CorA family divalent cation transporter [Chitinophagales bacterium]
MTEQSDGAQANHTVNQEEQLKTEITKNKQTDSNADWVSYHIFLFPFKWELLNSSEKGGYFSEKTDVAQFDALIQNHWERKPYEKFAEIEDFNEFHYFYPFVQDVLYDYEGNENVIRHFQFKNLDSQKDTFNITVPLDWKDNNEKESKPKTYTLHIKELLLNVYTTGIGILSFHLVNADMNSTKEDILCINQFGRRLYPPFLDAKEGLIGVQKKELAAAIKVNINKEIYFDKFSDHYGSLQAINYDNKPPKSIQLPEYISKILALDTAKIYYKPILDDRMFVVGWYGEDKMSKKLSAYPEDFFNRTEQTILSKFGKIYPIPAKAFGYISDKEASDFWYKYVFVDGKSKGLSNRLMQEDFLLNQTYDRWIENHTLYGFSRYSLMSLTGTLETLDKYEAAFLVTHLRTIYYKIAELCLVQRVSILNFSDEASHISTLPIEDQTVGAKIKDLYKNYLQFINKIYFREITAQEQGIEIYGLLQNIMNVERDAQNLDREIAELHNYADLIENQKRQLEQEKQNKAINRLTILGAALLLPTFIAGYYGMNIFDGQVMEFDKIRLWVATAAFIITPILLLIIFVMNGKTPFRERLSKAKNWFEDAEGNFLWARSIASCLLFIITMTFLIYPLRKQITADERNPETDTTKVEVVNDVNTEEIKTLKQALQSTQSEVDSLKSTIEGLSPKNSSPQNKK